jgi:anti-sigma factor RsiW
MKCLTKTRDGAEVLVEYCSGDLSAARSGEVARHVAECSECRNLVEAQREVWRSLESYAAPEVSPDFDARLYARIAEEESAPAWRRWVRRVFEPAVPVSIWKPAVSLALACAVLAVGLVVRVPNASEPATFVHQINTEHGVDIETVANALDDLEMLTPASAM